MAERCSRRHFVKQWALWAGTAVAVNMASRRVRGVPRNIPPSEKMNIAGVGIGGMGGVNLRNLESENIVALCDVDPSCAAKTIERYPKAKR
jgi:3-oxoacyl-(acyl-carrier-protein) synthase